MIAAWMLYCVAIALVFVAFGYAVERGLFLAGRSTRWAWIVALTGSIALPGAAWLRPEAFGTVAIPARQPAGSQSVGAHVEAQKAWSGTPALTVRPRGVGLAALDRVLAWVWPASSGVLLLVLAAAALRLASLRRRWQPCVIDGLTVWLSDDVGPAVIGLWPPRVVMPSWVFSLDPERRRLVLAHEVEHVRARDPWVLAAGTVALVVAPWNVAMWWLVRRLRLAVEIDCDARVVGCGRRAPEYGELLLQVGRRLTRLPISAPALGEPRTFLEHRIRRMAARLPRRRWLGVSAAAAVAGVAVVGACEAPRPVRPDDQASARLMAARVDSVMALSMRRVDSLRAERQRPWVRENLQRYYPELLREHTGPPVDVWLGHDSRLQVWQVARTAGAPHPVNSEAIHAALPDFRPGRDAWGVVSRRALQGLVRDNVRVIWVHLGDRAFSETAVDERPELVSAPAVPYPALLQFAGIQGVVWVDVIVDATGRPDPSSLKVVSSPHVGFNEAALSVVARSVFRPGRVNGQSVRVRTVIPIRFTVASDRT